MLNSLKSYGKENVFSLLGLESPRVLLFCFRFLFDPSGKVLSLLVNFNSLFLNIVNIYSPNVASDGKVFFSDLHNYFLSQGLLVIGSDFNCIDNVLDQFNCSIVPPADKTSLVTLLLDFSLVDVWCKQNPRAISYTWSNNALTQASRIDPFFIAKSLLNKVSCCEILPCVFSDHDYVKLDVSLEGVLGVDLVFGASTIPFCPKLFLKNS